MNKTISLLKQALICVLLGILLSCGQLGFAFAEGEDGASDNNLYIKVNADYERAYDVVSRVNSERSKRGLAGLDADQTLMDAAMVRAAEIVLYFEHARPNGMTWSSVDPKVTGENLARGSASTSKIMGMWMDSQGHRENILRDRFDSIGVAVIEYEGNYYWVQLFGSSPGYGAEYPDNGPVSAPLDLPGSEEGGEFALDYEISIDGDLPEERAVIELGREESVQLGLEGYPLTFDPAKVRWELSDPELAVIDEDAILTVERGGSATLTAYSGDIYRAEIEIDTRTDIGALPVLDKFPVPIVLSKYGPLSEREDYVITRGGAGEEDRLVTIRGINEYKGIVTL